MKLLGLFGKKKALPFPEFRDAVRLEVRRSNPGATAENTDSGFILRMDGVPITCNLRQLYFEYSKDPSKRDQLVQDWMRQAVSQVPEHTWLEARPTLRPILKNAEMIAHACKQMLKSPEPDSLPSQPFVGELCIIVMREIGGTLTGVTQKQLDAWGITFDDCLHEAINSMNLLMFPTVTSELLVGASTGRKQVGGEVVGLVFEGDHLTATWIYLERFRSHLGMILQGDYVISVPTRNRLTAIRVDEPSMIASMQASNRNSRNLAYSLTNQCFLVSAQTTDGVISLYENTVKTEDIFDSAPIVTRQAAAPRPGSADPFQRPGPTDFSAWGGISEPTGEVAGIQEKPGRAKGK